MSSATLDVRRQCGITTRALRPSNPDSQRMNIDKRESHPVRRRDWSINAGDVIAARNREIYFGGGRVVVPWNRRLRHYALLGNAAGCWQLGDRVRYIRCWA